MQMNNLILLSGANHISWFALFYKVNYGTYINLILFLLILVIAFYISKYFISKSPYAAPFHTGKVKERLYIGPQNTLTVIELQGIYYVVISDKGRTTLIDKRSDLQYIDSEVQQLAGFTEVLSKYLKK